MTIKIRDLKVGDQVGRSLAEGAFDKVMWLTVTAIDQEVIHCGLWTFDRETGDEIDHDLRWGPEYGRTGSRLVTVKIT
jgi:hypothetical protein